ncbi:MAG: HicB like antitoxin of bacterial toxin-antitoxin system [Geminicoccaceae bacterium]|nr:HicB like antitoxin of bacterial toxin-antitoxin system [Geminicoccaceae bacterium]
MARAKPSATGAAIRSFTAVIEPDETDGGYLVTFPAIPDLATQGETLDEARRMAEDCLRGYLEAGCAGQGDEATSATAFPWEVEAKLNAATIPEHPRDAPPPHHLFRIRS